MGVAGMSPDGSLGGEGELPLVEKFREAGALAP